MSILICYLLWSPPPRPQYLPLSPLADLAIVGRLCVTNPRCKCKRFYRSSVAPSTKWGPMWGEQTSTGDSMSLFFELMSWLMLPFFVPRSWKQQHQNVFVFSNFPSTGGDNRSHNMWDATCVWININSKVRSHKKNDIIWEFFPTWGGGSSQIPKLL